MSSFSPERNVVDRLSLIRADGTLKKTLACFQMLAQLMELPFRRDSIEKVLEDHLGRGLTPNLRFCGPAGGKSWAPCDVVTRAGNGRNPSAGCINAAVEGWILFGNSKQ